MTDDYGFEIGLMPDTPAEGHKYIIEDRGDAFVYHALNFSDDIGYHKDILAAADGNKCVGGGMAEVYTDDGEFFLYGKSKDFGSESLTEQTEVQEVLRDAYQEATDLELDLFTGDEARERLLHR